MGRRPPRPDREILQYYERGKERDRLDAARGGGPLEREWTREVLARHLPVPPATVVDVGGGAGVHALWLSSLGYHVHLRDPVPLHVGQAEADARERGLSLISAAVGDARTIDLPEASADVVLLPLAIFARWSRFGSERDFYRYAETNLRSAFPTLPSRPQFNRLLRSYTELIEDFFLHLAALLQARKCPYEALDTSAMPTRDCKRRGHGWMAGQADIGWSNSLGWYEGFSLLTAVDSTGVITGFCFGSASTSDQQMAETFFAVRAWPHRRLISVGSKCWVPYVAYSTALKEPRTTGAGSRATEHTSSIRPNATPASEAGPSA